MILVILEFDANPLRKITVLRGLVPPGVMRVPPGVMRVPPGVMRVPPGVMRVPPGVMRVPPGVTVIDLTVKFDLFPRITRMSPYYPTNTIFFEFRGTCATNVTWP